MSIGPLQILIILLIVLILFGAGKLPRIAGDLAKGIRNFKKGLEGDETTTTRETKKLPSSRKKK